VQAAAIALVHLLVLPGVTKRSTSPALIVPGLVIGVRGAITLAFMFWSGIPIILGLAAAALGAAGREKSSTPDGAGAHGPRVRTRPVCHDGPATYDRVTSGSMHETTRARHAP